MLSTKSLWLLGCIAYTISAGLYAQSTLAERLGYSADAKLLIIHADDLGVTHSENQASFHAIKDGSVNSASIMAPTPWLAEVAHYVKDHPDHDFGMHLTLTSEWQWLRWGPVAPRSEVSSLVDENGFFYPDCASLAKYGQPEEVEIELRAQVEQAIRMGINPTHLDSHMGCLFWGRPEYFSAYLKVAREYGIPAMVSVEASRATNPEMRAHIQPDDLLIDRIITASIPDYEGGMAAFYTKTLRELQAGVNVLLIHCAYDDRESQGMSYEHPSWGSHWRQQDTDFFLSQACLRILEEEDIQLITWREIGKLMKR
ncbi:MAG: polysaccharide deacetylase family protein [Bacteroidota bacterium]